MSVSHDSLPGDVLYVLESFIAEIHFDQDENLDVVNSIELNVGDKVQFVDWYYKHIENNINLMIKYKCLDNEKVFSAIESYFVTEEVWIGLRDYFREDMK
jgi:hypothetical protein